jgi:septin family protein
MKRYKDIKQEAQAALSKSDKLDEQSKDTDTCWEGYRQEGMKNKGGRQVPNCVPVTEGSYVHSTSELIAAIKSSQQELKDLKRKKQEAIKKGNSQAVKSIDAEIKEMEDNLADAKDQLG